MKFKIKFKKFTLELLEITTKDLLAETMYVSQFLGKVKINETHPSFHFAKGRYSGYFLYLTGDFNCEKWSWELFDKWYEELLKEVEDKSFIEEVSPAKKHRIVRSIKKKYKDIYNKFIDR